MQPGYHDDKRQLILRLKRIEGRQVGWYMGNPAAFSYSHTLWTAGFLKAIGSEQPLRLTSDPAPDLRPRWPLRQIAGNALLGMLVAVGALSVGLAGQQQRAPLHGAFLPDLGDEGLLEAHPHERVQEREVDDAPAHRPPEAAARITASSRSPQATGL